MLSYKSIVIVAIIQSIALLLLAYVGFSDMKSTLHNIIGIGSFTLCLGVLYINQKG